MNQKVLQFTCPLCGSHMFGTAAPGSGGVFPTAEAAQGAFLATAVVRCHGDEVRNCEFTWRRTDDHKYFAPKAKK